MPTLTRRSLMGGALALALPAVLPGPVSAQGSPPGPPRAADRAEQERNKEIVRRFKEAQGTRDEAATMREVLSPAYKRWRGGVEHLAANARDQGFPSPGSYLRGAFPDRHDEIVSVVAEGDMVGMLFRQQATHRGNFLGIPPTGRTFEIHELGVFRLAQGQIVESWFMADEIGLLQQLGARLPERKDGQRIAPPVTGEGEDPDAVVRRLEAASLAIPENRNRLMVARSKGAAPPASDRGADFKQTRVGFQHLRDHGNAKGAGAETITVALPDRRDRIDGFLAEGDTVWMRFKVAGTHGGRLYGLAPTGRQVEVPEIGIMRISDGKWKEAWYFADELGLLLQLGAVDMLLG